MDSSQFLSASINESYTKQFARVSLYMYSSGIILKVRILCWACAVRACDGRWLLQIDQAMIGFFADDV